MAGARKPAVAGALKDVVAGALVAVGVGAAVIILFSAAVPLYVTEGRVSEYLAGSLDGEFAVEVRSASFRMAGRSLALEGVTVRAPDDDGTAVFTAEEVVADRIGVLSLLGGSASVGRLRVDRYVVDHTRLPGNGRQHRAVGLGGVSVDLLELKDGIVRLEPGGGARATLTGVDVTAGPVNGDRAGEGGPWPAAVRNVEIDFASVEVRFRNGRHVLKADSLSLSEGRSALRVGSVRLEPVGTEREFFESLEYRTERFALEISGLAMGAVDVRRLREAGEIRAATATVDSLDLHVTVDRRIEGRPDRGASPLPLEALGEAPVRIAVDSVEFRGADIRYSEYAEDGARPGTIRFSRTDATVTGVRTGAGGGGPMEVRARSSLEGAGDLETVVRMSRDDAGPLIEARGTLGEFDARHLNGMLVDLDGIRVTGGRVHRLEFEFEMRESESRGVLGIHYDGFRMQKIDKVDRGRGPGRRISGLFLNRIVLRSSSGGDVRQGTIHMEREPGAGFFEYLWKSLRSGVLDVVKRV